MIRVRFDLDALPDQEVAQWRDWLRRSKRATAELKEQRDRKEPLAFQDRVGTELKQWMLRNVFHRKCSYCEDHLGPHGHMDHWRPRKRVTLRAPGGVTRVARDGEPHTGYWWVAYDWRNLVPACSECNTGKGKSTHFPVAQRHAFGPDEAADPDALDAFEEPLLLHPLRGPDPRDHLHFRETGHVTPAENSAHGRHTIDVVGLNRIHLVERRAEHFRNASNALFLVLVSISQRSSTFDVETEAWLSPRARFSASVRRFLLDTRDDWIERMGGRPSNVSPTD